MAGATEPGKGDSKNRDTIVVDIGKKSKKQIRNLRKGKGKLMDQVNDVLNELKTSGAITGVAQPVVIVVQEKVTMDSFMDFMRFK
jgi:hypothetical protein